MTECHYFLWASGWLLLILGGFWMVAIVSYGTSVYAKSATNDT